MTLTAIIPAGGGLYVLMFNVQEYIMYNIYF